MRGVSLLDGGVERRVCFLTAKSMSETSASHMTASFFFAYFLDDGDVSTAVAQAGALLLCWPFGRVCRWDTDGALEEERLHGYTAVV